MEFKEFKPLGRAGVIMPYNAYRFEPQDLYISRPRSPVTIEQVMFQKGKQLEADLFCGGAQSVTTATTQGWSHEPVPTLAELADMVEKFRRPRLYYAGASGSSALRSLIEAIPVEARRSLDVISDSPILSRPPVGPTWFAHLAPGIYKFRKDYYLVE